MFLFYVIITNTMAYWYDGAALAATRSPVIALFWCLIKCTTTTTTTTTNKISELLRCMQSGMCAVKAWATENMPRQPQITHACHVRRSKHLRNQPTSIIIDDAKTSFKQSVSNSVFALDCHLTMTEHVSSIAWTCYFELRRLASIRRFLTSTATATVVSAIALSRIDYCNSLRFGSTHDATYHFQRIQNYAARLILRLPKSPTLATHLNHYFSFLSK